MYIANVIAMVCGQLLMNLVGVVSASEIANDHAWFFAAKLVSE